MLWGFRLLLLVVHLACLTFARLVVVFELVACGVRAVDGLPDRVVAANILAMGYTHIAVIEFVVC